jgi:hypothetical protein
MKDIENERRESDIETARVYRRRTYVYYGCLTFSSLSLILAIVSLIMQLVK